MEYIPRIIDTALLSSLETFPVVMLEGARQIGKSTSAIRLCKANNGSYMTLDDPATRSSLAKNPVKVLNANFSKLQVIDEVQKMPELFSSIKLLVDRSRRPGMFLLTGSGDQYKLKGPYETLAGRKMSIFMHPMSQMEIEGINVMRPDDLSKSMGKTPTSYDKPMTIIQAMYEGLSPPSVACDGLVDRVVKGGYPSTIIDPSSKEEQLQQYVREILFGMFVEQLKSKVLVNLPIFFMKLSRKIGRQFNKSALASEIDDTEYSARTIYDLLHTSFVVSELPGYGFKLGKKKISRRPKVYLNDSGLLTTWLGLDGQDPRQSSHWGSMIENFVHAELLKHFDQSDMPLGSVISYYGEHNGIEVDFLINKGVEGDFVAIEVKATNQVDWHDTKNLEEFKRICGSKCRRAIILYSGSETKAISTDIEAWPLSCLWSWDLSHLSRTPQLFDK